MFTASLDLLERKRLGTGGSKIDGELGAALRVDQMQEHLASQTAEFPVLKAVPWRNKRGE